MEDLFYIAMACMDDKWYDTAINFARAAKELHRATGDSELHEESAVKLLDRIFKDLFKIQNTMLDTKRERVGAGK